MLTPLTMVPAPVSIVVLVNKPTQTTLDAYYVHQGNSPLLNHNVKTVHQVKSPLNQDPHNVTTVAVVKPQYSTAQCVSTVQKVSSRLILVLVNVVQRIPIPVHQEHAHAYSVVLVTKSMPIKQDAICVQ